MLVHPVSRRPARPQHRRRATAEPFGVRSEVNVYLGDREILITPRDYQRELIIL